MDMPELEQQAAHVRDYTAVLWRRKWLVLFVMVALSSAGLVGVYKLLPVTYQAQSRITLERISRLMSDDRTGGGQGYYEAQYQYIGSSDIAAAAAVKMNMSPSVEMARTDGSSDRVMKAVTVKVDMQSRIVTVSSRQRNAALAAQLVNALVDAYIEVTRQNERSRARSRQEDLNAEIVKLDARVASKREAIDQLAKDSNLQEQQRDQTVIQTTLTALLESAVSTRVRREQFERMFEETQRKHDAGEDLVPYTESPTLLARKSEMNQVENEMASMEVDRLPAALEKDLRYRQLKARLERLQREYAETSEKERKDRNEQAYENARRSLEEARRIETTTQQQIADERAKLEETAQGMTALGRYNELQKELASLQAMKDRLQEMLLQATINDTAPTLEITILDRAKEPKQPAWPNKTQLAIVVALLSVILAGALAFFLEYMDRSVRRPEDVEQELRLPLVGFVPSMHSANSDGRKHGRVVLTDPASGPAESYRKIRAKLFVYNKESHAKVFSVTSTTAGEGKTTLTSNLAIAFAQSGANVLLIDADMRHPTVQKIHDVEWTPGLGEYLAGMCDWQSVAKPSGIANLTIIPCGRGGTQSAELLESARTKELIEAAREAYDVVIIDTPPVLGVADSTILCNATDATIFVIQASRNSKWLVRRAQMELKAAGARVVGAVLNRVRSHRGDYYYYHRYYPKKA